MLHKVTSDLPLSPTPFDDEWQHLKGLELADPNFGTPGAIDLVLGTEIFGQVVLHGRQFGHRGSPMALKLIFERCSVALSTQKNSKVQRLVA